jgi:hypothetical protein
MYLTRKSGKKMTGCLHGKVIILQQGYQGVICHFGEWNFETLKVSLQKHLKRCGKKVQIIKAFSFFKVNFNALGEGRSEVLGWD